MSAEKTRNCYDAINDLDEALTAHLPLESKYFVLGGIATSAIKHPGSEYSHSARTVLADHASGDPILRENETVRDVDILVNHILSEDEASKLVAVVEEAVPELEVSVFGFESHEELEAKNAAARTASAWTSQRTIDQDGAIRYELFPLQQAVQPESFEPWRLETDGGLGVSVLSPPGHLLAYGMRSISGVRYKDTQKLLDMGEKVLADPAFVHEMTDGVFKEWLEFACSIYNLRDGIARPAHVTATEAAIFKAKSRTLRYLESKEGLIKIAQSGSGVKLLQPFVGNR